MTKAIQQCAKISDDKKRLVCFEQLAQSQKKSPVASITVVDAKDTSEMLVQADKATALIKTQNIDDFAKAHIEKSANEKAQEINSIELTDPASLKN